MSDAKHRPSEPDGLPQTEQPTKQPEGRAADCGNAAEKSAGGAVAANEETAGENAVKENLNDATDNETGGAIPAPDGSQPAPLSEAEIEASTLFGAGRRAEQKADGKTHSGRLLRNTLIGVLATVMLVVTVFLLVKFVPESDAGLASSGASTEIQLLSYKAENVERLDVVNAHGSFALYSEQISVEDEESEYVTELIWNLEGIDHSLTSDETINAYATNIANISCIRKMTAADADYGFDAPLVQIAATCRDDVEDYTVTIGKQSPDEKGYYLKVSNVEGIYLISTSTVDTLNSASTHFADKEIFAQILEGDVPESYFEDSLLTNFDSIQMEGSHFSPAFTIETDSYDTLYTPYLITQPYRVYADEETTETLFPVMREGLKADEVLLYNPTQADLVSYGLDQPDVVATFRVADITLCVHLKQMQDDVNSFAAYVPGRALLFKIARSNVSFVEKQMRDYFSDYIFMDDISTVSRIQIDTGAQQYDYRLSHKDQSTMQVTTADGYAVNETYFRHYYKYLAAVVPQERADVPVSGDAAVTLTVSFVRSDRPATVVKLYRHSDKRYVLTLNGACLGYVSAATVDELTTYAQALLTGEAIPDPAAL